MLVLSLSRSSIVIHGEDTAHRSITATISMRSHDLISQTCYVRDARRLWISATRSKGFPNVEREIPVAHSLVRSFCREYFVRTSSSLSNRYHPPLNGVTRYRPLSACAFCSRFPFPAPLCAPPCFVGKKWNKKKKKKLLAFPPIGPLVPGSDWSTDTVGVTHKKRALGEAKVALSRYNRNRIFEKYAPVCNCIRVLSSRFRCEIGPGKGA